VPLSVTAPDFARSARSPTTRICWQSERMTQRSSAQARAPRSTATDCEIGSSRLFAHHPQ